MANAWHTAAKPNPSCSNMTNKHPTTDNRDRRLLYFVLNYTGFNFKDMFFYQETLTRYSTVKINCFKTYQRNKNNKKIQRSQSRV